MVTHSGSRDERPDLPQTGAPIAIIPELSISATFPRKRVSADRKRGNVLSRRDGGENPRQEQSVAMRRSALLLREPHSVEWWLWPGWSERAS